MLGHLRNQFDTANPVLFTGAGFSWGLKNTSGRPISQVAQLRTELWKLCFGDEQFEEGNSLQDLFQLARKQNRNALVEFMTKEFNVDSSSLQSWHETIFSFPWHRIYTLNIDNLESAVNKVFSLPRAIVSSSATTQMELGRIDERRFLHVIHLNGALSDIPDDITFSFRQYAERLAREEPWLSQLASDLLARPIVFIGTELDEPPLWQYVEKRKTRGGRDQKELRPKSYLVVPTISRARQVSLLDYNISHVPTTAEEFTANVLSELKENCDHGQTFLRAYTAAGQNPTSLDEVSQLAVAPAEKTDFLLGSEPQWSDIQVGRAALREVDKEIAEAVQAMLQKPRLKGVIIISGTAGTGKSTSLKRISLDLSSSGHRVAWPDLAKDGVSPIFIRKGMSGKSAPRILAIDDADLFGSELSPLISDICMNDNFPLLIISLRSGKVDRVINAAQLEKVHIHEVAMPQLAESDIDRLLDVLTNEARLGVLRASPRSEQKRIFREKCGRQLLVAMIEATSGEPFHRKIQNEFTELSGHMQRVYAIVSTASAHRFFLNRNDILLAIDRATNDTLNAIDALTRRHLLHVENGVRYYARHRVIADEVFRHLVTKGEAAQVLLDLARSAALQINPNDDITRHRRLVRFITNHEFLKTAVGPDDAVMFYGEMEALLTNDHNFWLQRGSLAVENNNLFQAENFLGQARALEPQNRNVQTEYAYLLFRKAITNPSGSESVKFVEEAAILLRDNIASRGMKDPHSYHVLGSNLLDWIDIGIGSFSDRRMEIEKLSQEINDGVSKHPGNSHLRILQDRIKQTYLSMAVHR